MMALTNLAKILVCNYVDEIRFSGTNTENTSNVCSNTGIVDEALSKRIMLVANREHNRDSII